MNNKLNLKQGQKFLVKSEAEAKALSEELVKSGCTISMELNTISRTMSRGRSVHTVYSMTPYRYRVRLLADGEVEKSNSITLGLAVKSIKLV